MSSNPVPTRKHILSAVQVQQLRSVCDTTNPGGKRDLAILDSMLYQGMRLREVSNLRLEHIRWFEDQYFIHIQRRRKSIKAHTVWMRSLEDWLDQREVSVENDRGPIFVQSKRFKANTRKPLSTRTISFLVARYGNLAGIAPVKGANRLFPIELRRTCARNAYDHGARLPAITAFLGFNHLESTARFINVLELSDPDIVVDQIQYN
jgi:integrase